MYQVVNISVSVRRASIFTQGKRDDKASWCVSVAILFTDLLCSTQSVVYSFTEYYSVTENFFVPIFFTTEGCQKVTLKT